MDFGSRIRQLRKSKKISLRDFADQIHVDFTYLSKIENGKVEPPSEEKIRSIATQLGVGEEELLELAGKVSQEEIRKAVQLNPSVGILLRRIQSRNLTREQIENMVRIANTSDSDQDNK